MHLSHGLLMITMMTLLDGDGDDVEITGTHSDYHIDNHTGLKLLKEVKTAPLMVTKKILFLLRGPLVMKQSVYQGVACTDDDRVRF